MDHAERSPDPYFPNKFLLAGRSSLPGPFKLKAAPFLQAFNVLRYEIGQKYNSHYDYFATDEYGPQDSQRVRSATLTARA